MQKSKGTILECCLKLFTTFVGCITIVGLLGLTFCVSWVIVNNISQQASNILIAALLSIMGTRMVFIYLGTYKAAFKRDEKSWKRRSLAVVYSMLPSVAGLKALNLVYANKRNI
ncbi:hypothetical protein QBE52_15700 [Clostridiaceae bacterium 35-E11]